MWRIVFPLSYKTILKISARSARTARRFADPPEFRILARFNFLALLYIQLLELLGFCGAYNRTDVGMWNLHANVGSWNMQVVKEQWIN